MKLVASRGSRGQSARSLSAAALSYQQAPPLGQRYAGKLETKRNSVRGTEPGLLDLTDQSSPGRARPTIREIPFITTID